MRLLICFVLGSWKKKIKHNGKLPHGFVAQLVKHNVSLFPYLTRDTINNALRKHLKSGIVCPTSYAKHQPTNIINAVTSKHYGSFPKNAAAPSPPNAAAAPNNAASPQNNDAAPPNNDSVPPNNESAPLASPHSPTTPTIPPCICVTPSPHKELDSKGGRPKGSTIAIKINK